MMYASQFGNTLFSPEFGGFCQNLQFIRSSRKSIIGYRNT